MSIAAVRAAPVPSVQSYSPDGGFRDDVASSIARLANYRRSGWEATDAGFLEGGGGLTVETRRAGPPPTADEIRAVRHMVESQRRKIGVAYRAVVGPWDARTRKIAAECFLLPPSGPSPRQAATIKDVLSRMHGNAHGDVTIKLMDAAEVDELEAAGAVASASLRILAEPNHLTVTDMWTGKRTFSGAVRIDRKLLKGGSDTRDFVALHEQTHRDVGTVDIDVCPGQPAEAGTIDFERYRKTREIRYHASPTDVNFLFFNADSYAGFIIKRFDTLVPASSSQRNVAYPRIQVARRARHDAAVARDFPAVLGGSGASAWR
jgi:hypothetical protein